MTPSKQNSTVIFLALVLMLQASISYACFEQTQPPIKIVDAKISHSCLRIETTWFRVKPFECPPEKITSFGDRPEPAENVTSAIGIENNCGEPLYITEVAVSANTPKTGVPANPEAFLASVNDNKSLIPAAGLTCSVHDKTLYSYMVGLFSREKDFLPNTPPVQCTNIDGIDSGEAVRIALTHHNYFHIKGKIGDEPFSIEGRAIDPNNIEQAMPYFIEEEKAGDKKARMQLKNFYRRQKNYAGYYELLTKTAEDGEYSSQHILGKAYAEGREIKKNCTLAKKWLGKALENVTIKVEEEKRKNSFPRNGVPEMALDQIEKSIAYTTGYRCARDFDDIKSALKIWKGGSEVQSFYATLEAAKRGDSHKQEIMAIHYSHRFGDLKRSADVWLKLATQNNKAEWHGAAELQEAQQPVLRSRSLTRAEIVEQLKESQIIRSWSLLDDEELKPLEQALDGNTMAQYTFSRILFAAALKNYEEAEFWRLISHYEPYKYTAYPPPSPLTAAQAAAVEKRAREWGSKSP